MFIRDVELLDDPAVIRFQVQVSELTFTAEITYHSIPSWKFLDDLSDIKPVLLGAVIAWDAMRFLALGGERLCLPPEFELSSNTRAVWRSCFLDQFGEWRYRNRIHYRSLNQPSIVATEPSTAQTNHTNAISSDATGERWLLTNGGGKDTLTGILILNALDVRYDLYEGRMPFGGSFL